MKTKAMSRCILVLFLVSTLMMAASWYIPCVPLDIYYLGFVILLLDIAIIVIRRIGPAATLVLAIFTFFLLIISLLPIPIPIIEKDYPRRADEIIEKSDILKDKHPPYVPEMVAKRSLNKYRSCYVNKSTSVISLDLGEATSGENKLSSHLYPTFGRAVEAATSFDCELLPSVDLIDGYKKHLDDRILAALEEHLNTGSSIFSGGKQGLLRALLEAVLERNDPGREEAAAYLSAAIELGGGHPKAPSNIRQKANLQVKKFLKNTAKSTPIGFYSESKILQHVFRQDRFLAQSFISRKKIMVLIPIASALAAKPELLQAYKNFLTLNERACNAEVDLDLEDMLRYKDLLNNEQALRAALFSPDNPEARRARVNKGGRIPGVAFWPMATSPEVRLFARIYRDDELPSSNCMNDLIRALRSGETSLDTTPDSGYYDYQLHALETLVLPEKAQESAKMLLRAKYKKRLREAFEAMLTKRRETHVKDLLFLGVFAGSRSKPMVWTPELSIEPCATNYLRTARAYRFLGDVLKTQFTDKELSNIKLTGYKGGLLQELDKATTLFYGLYLVACNDIGMAPKFEKGEIESLANTITLLEQTPKDADDCLVAQISGVSDSERTARINLWTQATDWLHNIRKQKFLNEDVRVIIPVLTNRTGTQVRYWSVIGTKLVKIKAYYAVPPKMGDARLESIGLSPRQIIEKYPEGYRLGEVDWRAKEYVIPVQVFTEVTLGPKPLTRQEFRSICDGCSTKEEVINALKRDSWSGSYKLVGWIAAAVAASCLTALKLRRRHKKT